MSLVASLLLKETAEETEHASRKGAGSYSALGSHLAEG